jgi:hypothetical protein
VSSRGGTRLHPDAGGGGARGESNDLQPTGAAAHRDDRHALGSAARSRRRARAIRCRAPPARARAPADAASGTTDCPPGRASGSHQGRARGGQEPASDRPRPELNGNTNGTRRGAMVAIHRAFGGLAIVGTRVIRAFAGRDAETGALSLGLDEACPVHDFPRCGPASHSIRRSTSRAAASTRSPWRSSSRASCGAADEGRTAWRPRADSRRGSHWTLSLSRAATVRVATAVGSAASRVSALRNAADDEDGRDDAPERMIRLLTPGPSGN